MANKDWNKKGKPQKAIHQPGLLIWHSFLGSEITVVSKCAYISFPHEVDLYVYILELNDPDNTHMEWMELDIYG